MNNINKNLETRDKCTKRIDEILEILVSLKSRADTLTINRNQAWQVYNDNKTEENKRIWSTLFDEENYYREKIYKLENELSVLKFIIRNLDHKIKKQKYPKKTETQPGNGE